LGSTGSWCTKKYGHVPLCAWPERLHRYLTQAFPDRNFTLINSARSGGNIKKFAEEDLYWLRWEKSDVDLLLADHELNNIALVARAPSLPIAASQVAKLTRTFLDRLQWLERPPSLAFIKTFILSRVNINPGAGSRTALVAVTRYCRLASEVTLRISLVSRIALTVFLLPYRGQKIVRIRVQRRTGKVRTFVRANGGGICTTGTRRSWKGGG
jgi:hypothetical protein